MNNEQTQGHSLLRWTKQHRRISNS